MKCVSVKMAETLDRQTRIWAARLDINRSEFIRRAIKEKIKNLNSGGTEAQPTKPVAPERAGQQRLL